jgi:hypothetical protein
MNFEADLNLTLRARYPLIYIPSAEEERVEAVITNVAKSLGRSVFIWDFVDGYQSNPTDAGAGKRNPLQALEFVDKIPKGAVFVLRDFDRFLDDVAIARKLKNLARKLKSEAQNIIVLASQISIPDSLSEFFSILEFPLPNPSELKIEIEQIANSTNVGNDLQLNKQAIDDLVRASQGLSLERIRRVLAKAIAENNCLRPEDVELILEEKRQSIRQTQILEFYPSTTEISDIGGLDNLKEWLLRRGGAFSDRARKYGLPHPRGLLLAGIQGTGKSLTAKAISHHWHLPLLRLDVGRLFAGLVGESESRTRQMIQLAEALSPAYYGLMKLTKHFQVWKVVAIQEQPIVCLELS